VLSCTGALTPKSYDKFVICFALALALSYALPVALAQAVRGTSGKAAPSQECNADDSDYQQRLVRRAAYHVGMHLCSCFAVALFLPEPTKAAPLMSVLSVLNIARAQVLWKHNYGLDLLEAMWPFYVSTFGCAMVLCCMHASLERSQFQIYNQLRAANAARVEQLRREKERLEYERIFAIKRSNRVASRLGREPTGDASKMGNSQYDTSSAGCSHVPCPVTIADDLNGLGDDGAGAETVDTLNPQHLQCAPSVSDATCSELDMLTAMPIRPTETLFRLQPQFFNEEEDSSLLWLCSTQARAAYSVSVKDKLLCGPEGALLAPDQPKSFIFVVDATGTILAACNSDGEHAHVRHSSLVAGAAVAAAGEMTVHHGKLLSLSNWSGHYAPPPSSLGVVFDCLANMGMHDLKDVAVEMIAMQPSKSSHQCGSDAGDSSVIHSEPECWDPAQAMKS